MRSARPSRAGSRHRTEVRYPSCQGDRARRFIHQPTHAWTRRVMERCSMWRIMPRDLSRPVDTVLAGFRTFRREPCTANLDLGASESGAHAVNGSKTGRVRSQEAATQDNADRRAPAPSDETLIAFRLNARPSIRLVPASSARAWMQATNER